MCRKQKTSLLYPGWIPVILIMCFFNNVMTAQNNSSEFVTGIVVDHLGEPLIGVNVVLEGTAVGTMTDMDGHYSIRLQGENPVLVFSYIGYNQEKVVVGSQKQIRVILREDTKLLDDVVVIGYGTARKRDLTGAISTVRAEKLETESPRSLQDILRGNLPGMNISMSDNAAATGDLQIRGKNTLTAKSAPLIVLDGVIYTGDLGDINPMDIQSVDVLKDASSAAVYGAKASNGVVAVTTKKGKTGKPVVTFNASVGLVQVASLRKTLDPEGFIRFRQAYNTGKSTASELENYPGKFQDPRTLSGSGIDLVDWYNYTLKPEDHVTTVPGESDLLTAWLSRLDFKTPEIENYLAGRITNWDDLVFQTGLQQEYTASISNRTDNMSYYWSVGYTDREGVRVDEKYTNFRTRLNLESKITDFLTIGVNASYATRDETYLPVDNDSDGRMIADVGQRLNLSPYTANEVDDPDSQYRYYPNGVNTSVNPFYNPKYRDRKKLMHTLNANMFAQVKLPFGIEYQLNFTPYYKWIEDYVHNSSAHQEWSSTGGNSKRRNQKNFNWLLDNIVRWKHEFNHVHKVEVTLLANAEKGQTWETIANNRNYSPSDVLGYHRIQAGTFPTVSSNDTYLTGDALMARGFYSYQDKYMITASIRRDGYSAFGKNNPRATFPSVALGWVFTQEKFMQPYSDWMDYGKLRFSWGQNGNRELDDQYQALSNMTSNPHPYIDQNGNIYITSQLYVDRMSNWGLKWENTTAYNFGLDFSLFNNIISGSMEAYVSETNDLLVKRKLPEIVGYNDVMANLGKLSNKGFEISLTANIINNKNFHWESTGFMTLNRRKIKKLYGDMVDVLDSDGNVIGQKEADDSSNNWFIGQDPDRIWNYERAGVWQVGEEEEAAVYGLQPGDFKYIDQNEDGVLNDDDKVFQGYTTPRYRVTWRNEFTFYKNFTLSCLMYSNIGHYGEFNDAANAVSIADNRTWYDQPWWTEENPINDYARISSNNKGKVYWKRSFVRFENITLSYNVPRSFLNRFAVQNMRFALSVRNAFVIAPGWKQGDPEKGLAPRTYSMSVNFTL